MKKMLLIFLGFYYLVSWKENEFIVDYWMSDDENPVLVKTIPVYVVREIRKKQRFKTWDDAEKAIATMYFAGSDHSPVISEVEFKENMK